MFSLEKLLIFYNNNFFFTHLQYFCDNISSWALKSPLKFHPKKRGRQYSGELGFKGRSRESKILTFWGKQVSIKGVFIKSGGFCRV